MSRLDVNHFLGIYQSRKKMQDDGTANPSKEIKEFTKEFVDKLLKMSLGEEIKIEKHSFIDSKGNIIATAPIKD